MNLAIEYNDEVHIAEFRGSIKDEFCDEYEM